MKILSGHTSEQTAHLCHDYPWGFKMRTTRRTWIETRRGYGQRVVTQTQDPRTGRFCKPKRGNYHVLTVLYLNDDEHMRIAALDHHTQEEKIRDFAETYAEALTDDYSRQAIRFLTAQARAGKRIRYVRSPEELSPEERKRPQTLREQAQIFRRITVEELKKIPRE